MEADKKRTQIAYEYSATLLISGQLDGKIKSKQVMETFEAAMEEYHQEKAQKLKNTISAIQRFRMEDGADAMEREGHLAGKIIDLEKKIDLVKNVLEDIDKGRVEANTAIAVLNDKL